MALTKKRSLVSTCMASEDMICVHVVGVRGSSTDMILRNEEIVKILLDGDDRWQIVEYCELRLSGFMGAFLEKTLNPSGSIERQE